MKKAVVLALILAYAPCTTTTIYTPDGHVIFCQTCCDGSGSCTTFCF